MEIFDECFESLPDTTLRPADFDDFWNSQVTELRKLSIDTQSKRKISRKILSETSYSLDFQSAGKYRVHGHYLAPKKLIGKPPLVIIFQDYLQPQTGFRALLNAGIAQLTITLRGHESLDLVSNDKKSEEKKEEAAGTTKTKKGEPPIRSNVTEISVKKSPGYLKENLLEKRESYLTALYLDAYRALEVGRLRRESDSGRIAIWGRGTGCAMAIAAASLMNRATCLFLEKPALCALETSLRHSKGVWADEIKEGLKGPKKNRKKLQENIQYFDSLYFAEALKLPVGMAVNLTEDQNDPRSAFSLFHLLKDEKDMHLFTQDDALAKANEKRKIIQTAVRFFSKHILDKELEEDVKVTGEEEKRD